MRSLHICAFCLVFYRSVTRFQVEFKTLQAVSFSSDLGSRFQEAGYSLPKPLIPVHGIPMIEVVINNLCPKRPHRFTFICQREHVERCQLGKLLGKAAPGCKLIVIDRVTEGAACTVLLARDIIDCQQPLMIANCDQWIDASIDDYLTAGGRGSWDGFLMTMSATNAPTRPCRNDGPTRCAIFWRCDALL